jgi:hypothetical protein
MRAIERLPPITPTISEAERHFGVSPTFNKDVEYQPAVIVMEHGAEAIRANSSDGMAWMKARRQFFLLVESLEVLAVIPIGIAHPMPTDRGWNSFRDATLCKPEADTRKGKRGRL